MVKFIHFLVTAFAITQKPKGSFVNLVLTALLAFILSACGGSFQEPRSANTCDYDGSKPGAPWCFPEPAIFCDPSEESAEQTKDQVPDPRLLAQGVTVFTSKHSLGPNVPKCPPNGTRLIQELDEDYIRRGMRAIGKKVGSVLTVCELETERMARQPDNEILAGFNMIDPEEIEAAYAKCVKELETLPPMPLFEDPHLAMAASLGFKERYGDGVDEIIYRLWAIEIALAVFETAVTGGAELIEVAVTRGIRASLSVVRRMPIFIPGAIGGGGAFLMRAPLAATKVVMIGSSRRLGNSLKNNGFVRLIGEFAHHIVAHGDQRAERALKILRKYGVDVDDWVNGVYLPGFKTKPNPRGKIVHGNLHTDAYYEAVNIALERAQSKADVIKELRIIAFKLEHGVMP